MKQVTAYEAVDGSLHHTPQEAACADRDHNLKLATNVLVRRLTPEDDSESNMESSLLSSLEQVLAFADAVRESRAAKAARLEAERAEREREGLERTT